jgi:hypothetical protein
MSSKLAIAGTELLKGNIGNAIAVLAQKSVNSELVRPSVYRNGNYFFGVNGADKAFIWGNYNSSLIAYQQCPIVSAVINRKAQCKVNGKRTINDTKGAQSVIPIAKAFNKLFKRPNHMQTGMEFEAQTDVYKQIYGYCPVLFVKPVGFEKSPDKWTMWNIPPWMIQVMDNQELFYTAGLKPFKSVHLSYMGERVELDQDNLLFLKENQISTSLFNSKSSAENVSLMLPDSKLFSISKNINNIISSLDSRGALITERGPMWILTNDSSGSADGGDFPTDPQHKKDLQADFGGYGLMRGQKKAIITDAKLKLQTAGFDVSQLKLLEGEIQDAKVICDVLNYPPELMGLIDSKYDNQNIAERSLYVNSIIPDSESEDEQWANFLKFEDFGLVLKTDFSHLPAMVDNIAEIGRGISFMNTGLLIMWLQDLLTWNEWRGKLGLDTVPAMEGKYYSDLIKEGRILPMNTADQLAASVAGLAAMNTQQQKITA